MKTSLSLPLAVVVGMATGFLIGRSIPAKSESLSAGQVSPTTGGAKTSAGGTTGRAVEVGKQNTQNDPSQSLAGMSDDEVTFHTLQALREPDYVKRWAALGQIAAGMNAGNARAVMSGVEKRYREGGNTRREGELIQFCEGRIFGAAAIDPPREPNGRPPFAVQHKMRGWASANPLESRKWIEALPEGVARNAFMAKWQEGIKDAEPDTVASVFDQLTPDLQRTLAPKVLDGVFAKEGLDGLSAWYTKATTSGTDQEVVHAAWRDIVSRMSQDPRNWDKAAAFIAEQSSTVNLESVSFEDFTSRVALGAPGKVIDLFSGLAENSPVFAARLPSLIRQTIDTASGQTLNLVGEWLQGNREHANYDRVAYEFALRTATDDPEAAQQWAGTIKDESLRNQFLARKDSL